MPSAVAAHLVGVQPMSFFTQYDYLDFSKDTGRNWKERAENYVRYLKHGGEYIHMVVENKTDDEKTYLINKYANHWLQENFPGNYFAIVKCNLDRYVHNNISIELMFDTADDELIFRLKHA